MLNLSALIQVSRDLPRSFGLSHKGGRCLAARNNNILVSFLCPLPVWCMWILCSAKTGLGTFYGGGMTCLIATPSQTNLPCHVFLTIITGSYIARLLNGWDTRGNCKMEGREEAVSVLVYVVCVWVRVSVDWVRVSVVCLWLEGFSVHVLPVVV